MGYKPFENGTKRETIHIEKLYTKGNFTIQFLPFNSERIDLQILLKDQNDQNEQKINVSIDRADELFELAKQQLDAAPEPIENPTKLFNQICHSLGETVEKWENPTS